MPSFFDYFSAYCKASTAHCVKYIGEVKLSFCERLYWFCAFLLFAIAASIVSGVIWAEYDNEPTIDRIKDTHYPLEKIPFPAVTICPANRVKKSVAFDYFSRYFTDSPLPDKRALEHVMSALSLLQYPTYFLTSYHLKEVRKYLPNFDSLNISDFMIQVLPKCWEIMEYCYWHGRQIDCCQIFSLQRTEEGYCYSFNSRTSESQKHCSIVDFMQSENYITFGNNSSCHSWHITSSGGFSGLTVSLKNDNSEDRVQLNGTRYARGVVVFLSTTYEFPIAGSGALLETNPGETLEIKVSPILMASSKQLAAIPQEERRCLLSNEKSLRIYNYYTQSTCFLECRNDFIMHICGCQLYFFYDPKRSFPLCKVSQLECVSNLSDVIRKNNILWGVKNVNCNCILPCYGTIHETVIKRTNLTIFQGKAPTGLLDIFYSNIGAVKYEKSLTLSTETLLVNVGGVGNLFLGCSVISVLEVIYYLVKFVFNVFQANNRVTSELPNTKSSRIQFLT